MIVKFVKTGKTEEHDDSFAIRLVEQGKAIPCEPEPFMNEPEPADESEPADKKKAGKSRKGD